MAKIFMHLNDGYAERQQSKINATMPALLVHIEECWIDQQDWFGLSTESSTPSSAKSAGTHAATLDARLQPGFLNLAQNIHNGAKFADGCIRMDYVTAHACVDSKKGVRRRTERASFHTLKWYLCYRVGARLTYPDSSLWKSFAPHGITLQPGRMLFFVCIKGTPVRPLLAIYNFSRPPLDTRVLESRCVSSRPSLPS